MIRIIGDTHGDVDEYITELLPLGGESIQIGDMGIGFEGVHLDQLVPGHRFFRGNHDDPAKCRAHPNYMGDWGYDESHDIFWFAGADSIDKWHRTEGVSWWPDEELSYAQWNEALALYEEKKPRIVLSHDGPHSAVVAMFYIHENSRTRSALNHALTIHSPDIWLFGHHHQDKAWSNGKTLFRCVANMSYYDLETSPRVACDVVGCDDPAVCRVGCGVGHPSCQKHSSTADHIGDL